MADLAKILQRYGTERQLAPGEVLIRQGTASDGVYYLQSGRLGAYREEEDGSYSLSEIEPGKLVGELASATGWLRTVTVKAEAPSVVVHVPQADFQRAMAESPDLATTIVRLVGERLTDADVARVSLGRSHRRALGRVEKLSSEKAQLEELLRLREELADMIVHDLRNPLTVIASGVEMLRTFSFPESDAQSIAVVLQAMARGVERMQRLVNGLLDIARLEEGRMTLQIERIDVGAVIADVLDVEQQLAEQKHIALEARLSTEPLVAQADREVLQRVLINLVDNALKFAPQQGQVWIEGRALAEDAGVQIAVVDTGPGVPVEERERIFEKFTRVRGQAPVRRGVGLGLTFCQMAVEAHGGQIWIEDGPGGRGSRFVFTILAGVGGNDACEV